MALSRWGAARLEAAQVKVVGCGDGQGWGRRSQKKWGGPGEGGLGWGWSWWGISGWWAVWVSSGGGPGGGQNFALFFFLSRPFFIFLKLSGFFVDLCRWFGRFDFQKLCKTCKIGVLLTSCEAPAAPEGLHGHWPQKRGLNKKIGSQEVEFVKTSFSIF